MPRQANIRFNALAMKINLAKPQLSKAIASLGCRTVLIKNPSFVLLAFPFLFFKGSSLGSGPFGLKILASQLVNLSVIGELFRSRGCSAIPKFQDMAFNVSSARANCLDLDRLAFGHAQRAVCYEKELVGNQLGGNLSSFDSIASAAKSTRKAPLRYSFQPT